MTSLKSDNQSKEEKQKRYSKVETLYSLGYFVIEIERYLKVNMNCSLLKILKSLILNSFPPKK